MTRADDDAKFSIATAGRCLRFECHANGAILPADGTDAARPLAGLRASAEQRHQALLAGCARAMNRDRGRRAIALTSLRLSAAFAKGAHGMGAFRAADGLQRLAMFTTRMMRACQEEFSCCADIIY